MTADAGEGGRTSRPRMRGGLRQRSTGSWEYFITVTDPLTGRKEKRWRTFRGTRYDAEKERRRLQHEADMGSSASRGRIFAAAYDEWIETVCRATNARAEVERKVFVGRAYLKPALGRMKISEVSAQQVNRLYANARLRKRADGRQISVATVARVHQVLRAFYSHLLKTGQVLGTPFDRGGVERPREERYTGHPLTAEQASKVIRDLRGTQLGWMVALALAGGLRRGEILALAAETIDLEAGLIEVRRSVDDRARPLALKRPKSKTSSRTVWMDPAFMARLESLVEEALRRPPFKAPDRTELHLLFAKPDGTPLDPGWVSGAWAKFRRQRRTGTRHTCAGAVS